MQYPYLPFGQGVHAGRRLLLAEPISNAEAVKILPSPGLNIEIGTLPAYFVLDLGRVIHGRVQARVTGKSGAIIDIGMGRTATTRNL